MVLDYQIYVLYIFGKISVFRLEVFPLFYPFLHFNKSLVQIKMKIKT